MFLDEVIAGLSPVAAKNSVTLRSSVEKGLRVRSNRDLLRQILVNHARDGAALGVRPLHVRRVLDDYFQIDGQPGAYSDHAGLLAEVEIAGPGKPLSDPSPLALDLAQALLHLGREKAQLRRGEHRLWAGTGAAASLATLAMARRVTVTRRKLLKDLLFGVPAAAMLSCAGIATLAERFIPEELRGYDEIDQILWELRPRR